MAIDHLAITFVRGVGDGGPNASFEASRSLLESAAVDLSAAREINWSWQDFVPRAYSGDVHVIDLEYVRRLGAAIRTVAMIGLSVPPGARVHTKIVHRLVFGLLQQGMPLATAATLAGIFGSLSAALALGALPWLAACGALTAPAWLNGVRFICVLRAVILLLVWPVIFVCAFPATFLVASTLAIITPIAVTIRIVEWLPPNWLVWQEPGIVPTYTSGPELLIQLGVGVASIGMLLPVVLLIYRRARAVLSPTMKVVADIVFYLGDPVYRASLWDHVRESLEESYRGGARSFLILSHSLGTVISTDVLRFQWSVPDAKILLVTSGSPLRRVFHRFFPDNYPSPADMRRPISNRFGGFTWVNVYRPYDPIGGALGLPRGTDVSSGQRTLPWTRAHVGYWDDPHVHEITRLALVSAPVTESTRATDAPKTSAPAALPAEQCPSSTYMWIHFAVLIGCTLAISTFAWEYFVSSLPESERRTRELRDAPIATARLFAYDEKQQGGTLSGQSLVRRYEIELLPPVTSAARIAKLTLVECNPRKLHGRINSGKEVVRLPHPATGLLVASTNVEVRFEPGQEGRFMIPACARWKISRVIWAAAIAVFLALFAFGSWVTYGLVSLVLPGFIASAGLTSAETAQVEHVFLPAIDSYGRWLWRLFLILFFAMAGYAITLILA